MKNLRFTLLLLVLTPDLCQAQANIPIPRIPINAAKVCVEQYGSKNTIDPLYLRWIWIRHWGYVSDEQTGLVTDQPTAEAIQEQTADLLAINAINRSATIYKPTIVVVGNIALIPVDFNQLADSTKERDRILAVWDSMGYDDPWFHGNFIFNERVASKTSGADKKFDLVTSSILIPALHLEGYGTDLNKYAGATISGTVKNGNVEVSRWNCCVLPLAAGDWVVHELVGSIGTERYLQFLDVKPGETKFGEYLKRNGIDLKTATLTFKIEQAGLLSNITGKQRAIVYVSGQGKVTNGPAIAIFTLDIRDNNLDPNADPLLSFLDPDVQAIEAFLPAANGGIEATLWQVKEKGLDGILNAKSLAEAPPDIASNNDPTLPGHGTRRLHGFVTCAGCHGPNEMYQPFENEVRDQLFGLGILTSDVSKGERFDKLFQNYRDILSRYNARQDAINDALQTARDSFDRYCFHITDELHNAGLKACLALAKVYNRHEYEWVDTRTALQDAGIEIPANDPLGVITFHQYVPPLNKDVLVPEGAASLFARLSTVYETVEPDPKNPNKPIKVNHSLKITRRQYEQILNDYLQRVALINKGSSNEENHNLLGPGYPSHVPIREGRYSLEHAVAA